MSPNTAPQPNTFVLPTLELGPIRHNLGQIRHILDFGGTKEIVSIEDFNTSPRIVEKLYILSDGQKIVVTNKKKLPLPIDIDGVLHSNEQGELKWIAHRKLEVME